MDVEDTLDQLTLDEKIRLLSGVDFWRTAGISRLGIPPIRLSDGPNGVRGAKFFNGVPAACAPCGTCLGATWDTYLIRDTGNLMGREAKAKNSSVLLGPTINMQRSPIGGRGFESFSEDPVLAGKTAAAMVDGIQSTGVASAIKHFVANDQEEQRHKSDSIITDRALREIYLLPFQIAERESKPMAYMTSYNRLNGKHVCETKDLIQGILRDEWGFDGTVVSDWYGTYSTSDAIAAGLDLEMPGPTRWRGPLTKSSIGSGKISVHDINERARGVLKLVSRVAPLGLDANGPDGMLDTPETSQQLRQVASSGIVLLKNENEILPLKKEQKIAVIGPNARFTAYRWWLRVVDAHALGAVAHKRVPLLSSISKTPAGNPGLTMRLYHDPVTTPGRKPFDAFDIQDSACVLFDYKHPDLTSNLFYGEVEGTITPDVDSEYLFSLCVSGTARLFVNGCEVVDNETKQVPGDSFFSSGTREEIGTMRLRQGETYTVLVIFGSAPTATFGKGSVAQMGLGGLQIGAYPKTDPATLLSEAVALAKDVDRVVLCVGLNGEWESEGWDRPHMDLPEGANALVDAVVAANPNVVVVNQSGTPVTMPWVDKVPAVVQAWYGGNETGNAIGDVLFGVVNPSGKLPLSWPARLEDNPAFINTRVSGGKVVYGEGVYIGYRWYETIQRDPLFPFGHGLSYTTFSLSDLVVMDEEKTVATEEPTVTATVQVTNTGTCDGAEVVQLYVAQPRSSVQRPPKELKGFAKVFLKAGETKSVNISVAKRYAGSFWDEVANKWALEKGEYKVLVGNSSQGNMLAGEFHVHRQLYWKGL